MRAQIRSSQNYVVITYEQVVKKNIRDYYWIIIQHQVKATMHLSRVSVTIQRLPYSRFNYAKRISAQS